jgi:probable selenium-dependent hydroxylase accessory protein YqeC
MRGQPSRKAKNCGNTLNHEDFFLFIEPFAFNPHALVNFVGGGGKTALIHKLMDEYCHIGPVLSTTTTRIHPPAPAEGLVVVSTDNLPLLKTMVARIAEDCSNRSFKLVAARHFMSPTLLRGVPPDFNMEFDRKLFTIFLNEADGAAGFSIKLPRENEPILMQGAEYLVPVIGIDCLYQPMGPDAVFRWRDFAESFSLQPGERLTPELAAGILMHKEGVCKGWTLPTTIIPFINKVDGSAQDSMARELAELILNNESFPVERVVFGSVIQGRADFLSIA